MNLYLNGNDYHYAIEQLTRVFLPDVQMQKYFDCTSFEGEYIACTSLPGEDAVHITLCVHFDGMDLQEKECFSGEDGYKAGELGVCQMLYRILTAHFDYIPQWGIQTGVRPSKIYFNLLRNNSADGAVKYLKDSLFISESKVALVKAVCENELPIMESADKKEFSLYVSIPFCPSRCSYCSFISHSYDSIKKLIPDYVALLCKEIKKTADVTNQLGLTLRTVYIGGGTPTVLSAEQLCSIFDSIRESFDLKHLTECTLEAGRPETLTEEKLRLIKDSFVTRITINAQSFNDEVLAAIGRKHSAQDIRDAYALARKHGFDNINTDLIAGLEGESVESFLSSVKEAIALGAENITIHTLALKRSSFLITRDAKKGQILADTSRMIEGANLLLAENGYVPYYMYRQSKSVGNLENTGWAKPGKICEYNIFMMEEVENVFGAGAGAVTRLICPEAGKIDRIFNFKYPYEYIRDFEVIVQRKSEAQKVLESYAMY